MMRQKLALVVLALPSRSLNRMNGFSPVRITRFGSAVLMADVPPVGITVLQSRCGRHRRSSELTPPFIERPPPQTCWPADGGDRGDQAPSRAQRVPEHAR